ncbi:MAG: GTPase HflX [Chloroflexi bacterium]|nr:GTPase HflX [Chloroflexota bacterium]
MEHGDAKRESVYLVGLDFKERDPAWPPSVSLAELETLLDTVGASSRRARTLQVRKINPATLIGRGQAENIAVEVAQLDCDAVVFDSDLKPRQQRNLEKAIGVKIVDRTALILDVFAHRATTAEGKLQVERAQIEYLLPRLSDLWVEFSRTGGGIGTRGPGETQIEVDRQQLRARLAEIDRRLEHVRSRRSLIRESRKKKDLPTVAIVGYTNAGKSSLLNALSEGGAYVEDKLFATLDPLTRRVDLPDSRAVLAIDTVGFMQRLPTRLIAAFRATLEEIREADLLLHVVDLSAPNIPGQILCVEETLEELEVSGKPVITVLNKVDLVGRPGEVVTPDAVVVSTKTDVGLDDLRSQIAARIFRDMRDVTVAIPFSQGRLVDLFHREGTVENVEYDPEGTVIKGAIPTRLEAQFREFELTGNRRSGGR